MTDYEMLMVFTESVNTLWFIFTAYVSVVFAFLVVAYLVSGKLDRPIVAIVITLYSLVALWAGWAINRASTSLVAAVSQMKQAIRNGESTLAWHPSTETPDLVIAIMPTIITSMTLLAFVGSLAFFFYHRRATRET